MISRPLASPERLGVPPPNQQLCVLFVDDDADTLEAFALYLRNMGCAVHVAHSGRDALRLANVLRPDVVVLDVVMPKVDGISVMQALREQEGAGNMAIVLFSALPARRYPDHQADAWLEKPCQPSEMLEVVQRVARRPN
jgi:DNA-binding response OmpR family regulator